MLVGHGMSPEEQEVFDHFMYDERVLRSCITVFIRKAIKGSDSRYVCGFGLSLCFSTEVLR